VVSVNASGPLEVYRDFFTGPCQGNPACYTEFVAEIAVSPAAEMNDTVTENNALHRAARNKM
jgi:hypothetical protein